MTVGKWDERVMWSFKRLVYHVFALHASHRSLDEEYIAQMYDWVDECVDLSIRKDCRQLISDSYTKVITILEFADNEVDKVDFKIDVTLPMKTYNLSNGLRFNDLLDMDAFFNIPCVKEAKRYVKEVDIPTSGEVREPVHISRFNGLLQRIRNVCNRGNA